ncbi:MAG TPA: UDP-N-acetylmuramoyl-tripeptide--D-alanyl-D-alanine ligase [Gaiellaceae bacterium]
MIPLTLGEVAALAPGELRAEPWAKTVTGVKIDSRRIEEGDLFVAIGSGSDFRKHAVARGAAATLVPDAAFEALAALGKAVRDRSQARVVAITGSIGKTTTKDLLAAICAPKRRTVAAERSYNNELGVPLTLCRLEPDTELCILELAMRGFGQIAELAALTRPEVGIVTAIAPVHLEKVGSLEGVVRAKSELIAALPAGGTAVVPAGFPVERGDLRVVRVGEDVTLDEFEPPRLVTSLGTFEVGFTARHLAVNALTALATAEVLEIDLPERIDATFAEWRNQELELPAGGLLINDAWNAHPISMRAALEHLAERAGSRRRVAVLGEMAELGDYADEAHREVARAVEEIGVDVLIAVGPQAQVYGGRQVTDAAGAIEALREELRPGDAVLVKGARVLGLETVADALAAAVPT